MQSDSHSTPSDASRRSRSHHSYTHELRYITAALDDAGKEDVVSIQQRAFDQLAEWMEQVVDKPTAEAFSGIFATNLDPAANPSMIQAMRKLSRTHRRWAEFFLTEARHIKKIAHIKLNALRADELRDFALSVVRLRHPDLRAFATEALNISGRLTERTPDWGQIVLFRSTNTINAAAEQRVDRTFTLLFGLTQATLEPPAPLTGRFEIDHPLITTEPIRQVANEKVGILVDDLSYEQEFALDKPCQSVVCAPILAAPLGNPDNSPEARGVLLIASQHPHQFDADDLDALIHCGSLIALGLDYIAELKGRENWMHQVMHDLSKTMRPLLGLVRDIEQPLSIAVQATNVESAHHAAQEADRMAEMIRNLVFLTNDLMYWAMDLTDDVELFEDEASNPVDAAELVHDLEPSVTTLARILTDYRVIWQMPAEPLYLVGGETRNNLIKAILFKYIENALKYGSRSDALVAISGDAGIVEFSVCSTGPQVNAHDVPLLFDKGFRGSNVREGQTGAGYGLAQVKRIATLLGGTVGYLAQGSDQNVFWLRVPSASRM